MCLPRYDHVYSTTNESFRSHNQNFDEMRCKLDSTENPRSFEESLTPPQMLKTSAWCGKPQLGEIWVDSRLHTRLNRRARATFSSAHTMRAILTFHILKFKKLVLNIFSSNTWTSSNQKFKKFRPRYLEIKTLESRTSYEIRTFEYRTVLE